MSRKKLAGGVAPRTKAEWVSLLISLLLLAGVVGTVVALWLNPSGNPARFRVDCGAIRNEADRYYLPITVANEGDATAAQVTVEGRLRGDGGEEIAATTFDFIPARSRARGVLIFKGDPATAEILVVSYQQP
ncbi:MAG: hypothetical protein ACREEM_06865 [Blastocatellia bacterium]